MPCHEARLRGRTRGALTRWIFYYYFLPSFSPPGDAPSTKYQRQKTKDGLYLGLSCSVWFKQPRALGPNAKGGVKKTHGGPPPRPARNVEATNIKRTRRRTALLKQKPASSFVYLRHVRFAVHFATSGMQERSQIRAHVSSWPRNTLWSTCRRANGFLDPTRQTRETEKGPAPSHGILVESTACVLCSVLSVDAALEPPSGDSCLSSLAQYTHST